MIATFITLGIVALYAAAWFAGTIAGARHLANTMKSCRYERYGSTYCAATHVGLGHWRGDGRVGVRELWAAALMAALWPLLLLPALAWVVANKKPTARASELRIEELERELGIGERK